MNNFNNFFLDEITREIGEMQVAIRIMWWTGASRQMTFEAEKAILMMCNIKKSFLKSMWEGGRGKPHSQNN